jgi:ATP/maltotriose-dependent transcriptional regulator MalT
VAWYRFHPLFRDLLLEQLRARRGPAAEAALHSRAGRWLAVLDTGPARREERALAGALIALASSLVRSGLTRDAERVGLALLEQSEALDMHIGRVWAHVVLGSSHPGGRPGAASGP